MFSYKIGGSSNRGTGQEVMKTTRIQNVCLSFDLKRDDLLTTFNCRRRRRLPKHTISSGLVFDGK